MAFLMIFDWIKWQGQFLDVICINRYYSWYSDTGHLELIEYQMMNEVTAWHDKHSKPVIVTEYGAGSLSGMHAVCIWIPS